MRFVALSRAASLRRLASDVTAMMRRLAMPRRGYGMRYRQVAFHNADARHREAARSPPGTTVS
jgi:hypothetical protein